LKRKAVEEDLQNRTAIKKQQWTLWHHYLKLFAESEGIILFNVPRILRESLQGGVEAWERGIIHDSMVHSEKTYNFMMSFIKMH